MQEKDRKICFSLNVIAVFLIFVIVYYNYNLLIWYSTGTFEGLSTYLPYFVTNISAFLCSLLLQSEEFLMIVRRKKSLLIRWELIVLGVVTFLLGLIKFWYILLFPNNNVGNDPNFSFAKATVSVLGGNIDLVFMFVAGIIFVHAFHIQDSLIEKKNRNFFFILYALLVLLIVVIDYCNVWFFQSKFNKMSGFVYILYSLNIFKIFAYSLVLQGEKILTIIHNKKELFVRRELIILGIIALLFAIIKLWSALILYDSTSTIIQSINTSSLWQIAYTFAAGMFFVRAFQIKTDQIDLKDSELNENK